MGVGTPLLESARGAMASRVTGPGEKGQAAASADGLGSGLGDGCAAASVVGGGGGGCMGEEPPHAARQSRAALTNGASGIRVMAASAGERLTKSTDGRGRDERAQEGGVGRRLLDLVDQEL